MLRIEHISFAKAWPLIEKMTHDHFDQVSMAKGKLELNVDTEFYLILDELGRLEMMTINDGNEVVGYCCFITATSHPRYKGKSVATNDVLFLREDYRVGMNGYKVLKNINEYMKARYNIVTWHVKDKFDFGPILTRDGFTKQETVYAFFGD